MPSRKWKFRIQDILESIDAVQSYVADHSSLQMAHRNHFPQTLLASNPPEPASHSHKK